jgi:hypothetical protein
VRTALLMLMAAACVCASTPKLVYTRAFPGSAPAYFSVSIARSGELEYKEAPNDEQPLKVQLEDAETAPLFELAGKLEYFKSPLESGLKVANTGKKTFRYENEAGVSSEVTFNFSLNPDAQTLLTRFEQIASTEQAFLDLDQTVHYDKLGVNDALAQIESLWLHKQLVGRQQFLPLLTRIATHESFMHLVRERAARLKDEFSAPPTDVSAGQAPK